MKWKYLAFVLGSSTCLLTFSIAQELPSCRYDDVLTAQHDFEAWPYTLLDTIYHLPADYEPTDLVSLSTLGFEGRFQLRSLVLEDLAELVAAASDAGNPIAIQSAYRSYGYQQQTFNYWLKQQGREQALRSSARPGHSEHQLGTAIDVRSKGGPPAWELADWVMTPAGAWMKANAWNYGFIMSYPKGQEAQSCYDYEPWHYRYVGKEVAAQVHHSGQTLRAWLWSRSASP